MIPDAEILSLVCTILTRLEVGDFTIKVNHRRILDGIFEVCGVPPEKIRTISSAVDKLDKVRCSAPSKDSTDLRMFKLPWAEVKKEMTETKGLDSAVADKIGEYVKHKGLLHLSSYRCSYSYVLRIGGVELLSRLEADAALTANPSAKQGLSEMAILFRLLNAYNVLDKVTSFIHTFLIDIDLYFLSSLSICLLPVD